MRKIWHVVMPEATVTFLDYDQVQEFLQPMTIDNLINGVVVCESEVSEDHFALMADWQRRPVVRGGDDDGRRTNQADRRV